MMGAGLFSCLASVNNEGRKRTNRLHNGLRRWRIGKLKYKPSFQDVPTSLRDFHVSCYMLCIGLLRVFDLPPAWKDVGVFLHHGVVIAIVRLLNCCPLKNLCSFICPIMRAF